jgi:uncharacterized protein DUF3850
VPVIHELKTHPQWFFRLYTGEKTFEIRRDDRGYQAGDILILREFKPDGDHDECDDPSCTSRRFTGRRLIKRVGFVAKGTVFGLSLGEYAVLSLLDIPDSEEGHADRKEQR